MRPLTQRQKGDLLVSLVGGAHSHELAVACKFYSFSRLGHCRSGLENPVPSRQGGEFTPQAIPLGYALPPADGVRSLRRCCSFGISPR